MFSFKRFSEQFKIILRQNAQRQGLNLLVMALIFIFFHFVMFYEGGNKIVLDFKFWGFVVAIMTLLNSTGVFSALLRTESGINYYMTPASIGEKYAAAWLYSSLLTIGAYTAVMFSVHFLSINIGNLITGQSHAYMFPDMKTFRDGFLSMMALHSFFFLGAVVFKKNPFGKTILTIVLFNFVVGLIIGIVVNLLYNQHDLVNYFQGFNNINIELETYNGNKIPSEWIDPLTILKYIGYSVPFVCWIAAYFRLKTREV